jgi:hypothetical protein
MSDKENLTEFINLCWDAVNASKVGPILSSKDGVPQMNNIGIQTFYTIVSNIVPKNIQSQVIEPREPWQ